LASRKGQSAVNVQQLAQFCTIKVSGDPFEFISDSQLDPECTKGITTKECEISN